MNLSTSNSEKRKTLLLPSRKHILQLARTRLKKCVSIAPRLLVDDDPNDIHGLRVSSRRLQQILGLLFPKPRHGKSRKVLRSLRDLRRDWSACRNHDVNLALLQEKLESLNTDGARDAWGHVREYISELRAQDFAGAHKQLGRLDIVGLIKRTQRLFEVVKIENVRELNLEQSLAETLAEWNEAVAQAKTSQDPKRLHELRISGKRLRYRLEVLAELGERAAKSQVESLKVLQDELGRWHDRHLLLQFVTDLYNKPEFVRNHSEFGQILERDIDVESLKNNAAIEEILKQGELLQLELDNRKTAVEQEAALTDLS